MPNFILGNVRLVYFRIKNSAKMWDTNLRRIKKWNKIQDFHKYDNRSIVEL